jgi:hypothetical protein
MERTSIQESSPFSKVSVESTQGYAFMEFMDEFVTVINRTLMRRTAESVTF